MPLLLALGDDMADGAHNHGAAIKLKQNDEPAIRLDLDAARAAWNAYQTANRDLNVLYSGLRTADSNARAFLKAARATLAQSLGERWSAAWKPTGFPNQSTAVPNTQDERFTLCKSLADFLTASPEMEVNSTKVIVTAVRATTVYNALKVARNAVNDGNTLAGQAKVACDAAEVKLRARMRGLVSELTQLLDDNDPLWEAFGLTEPGSDKTPDVPTAMTVTAGLPGCEHANWPPARRADHYRLYKKVVGVDDDFVYVSGPTDCEFTYTDLPSGATVQLTMSAVNDAGESAKCAPVQVVVP